MFCGKAAEKGIELIISVADNVPNALIGDPLRLGQVLINLTTNAVKFTGEGEVFVQVSLISKEEDRVRLRFSVKDSGIGIPKSQLPRLFSAFTQADGSTTRKYGGTGLGLAICRKLVELMKGEIWAESEVGMGSTFFFTAEFMLQSQDREIRPQIPESLARLKILVVDDNVHARNILEEYLKTFNFSISLADSGKAAIQRLNSGENHDLVIIDWMMPEMDGITTLQKIREKAELVHIPVILMTAFGREEVMKQAEAAGVNAFLIKPIKQSVLLDTIMDVFGHEAILSSEKFRYSAAIRNTEHFRNVSILLAEDNAINRQIATEILSSAGIIVDIAENGREAVDKVLRSFSDSRYAYDAVLMDVQMPEMDGYEATRIIREAQRHRGTKAQRDDHHSVPLPLCPFVPIIAMTAHAMTGDREKCLNAGMNDYITKPIDTEHLFDVLSKWIRKETVQRATCEVQGEDSLSEFSTLNFELCTVIDTDTALKRLSGNKRLLQSLIQQFGQTYSKAAQELRSALAQNDMQTALKLVHTIKGVSGNISAIRLYDSAVKLENALRSEHISDIAELTDSFEISLKEILGLSRQQEQEALPKTGDKTEIRSDLAESLLKLDALLKDNDLDAEEFFDSIKADLAGPDDDMRILEKNIRMLDFGKARQALRKLSESFNISMPED